MAGVGTTLLVLATDPAVGASWQVNPDVDLTLGYDDNARFSAEATESSWVSTARGAVGAARATETTSLGLGAEVNLTRYAAIPDLNNTSGRLRLGASYAGERNRIGVQSSFVSQSTLTSEVATSGLNQFNIQQYSFELNPSWAYLVSERSAIDLGLSYQNLWYEDVDLIPLYNYTVSNATFGGNYRLSERTVVTGRLAYGRYDTEHGADATDNLGAQLGASYLFSETLSLRFLLGLRHTEASSSGPSGLVVMENSTGPTFVLDIGKQFERGGGVGVQATRDLSPSGAGEVLDTTALSLRIDYPVTERWGLSFEIRGNRNRQPGGESGLSVTNYAATSLGVGYALDPNWMLSAGYRYRWQESAEMPEAAQANAVFLTVAWNPPMEL